MPAGDRGSLCGQAHSLHLDIPGFSQDQPHTCAPSALVPGLGSSAGRQGRNVDREGGHGPQEQCDALPPQPDLSDIYRMLLQVGTSKCVRDHHPGLSLR